MVNRSNRSGGMNARIKRFSTLALVALFAASGLSAQESQDEFDMDFLFGEEMVEEISSGQEGSAQNTDPLASLLKREGTRIGGSFSGSLDSVFTWSDLWTGGTSVIDPEKKDLALSLASTLYFDARPTEDFRAYGSVKTGLPLSFSAEAADAGAAAVKVPNIRVFELFSDFNLDDRIFFRFGKSTVKWGVGYFWSPADVINLESINILDAEAQREGPVNFRAHLPVLGTQNNFYFYTILDNNDIAYETTALAAKAEFLLGGYELGLGAYYRYDTAERAMLTLTGPIGDLDIFGEAMLSRGSAKTFVTQVWPSQILSTSDDHRGDYYFSASAGFRYSNSNDNFNALGQYFYNGEGYADSTRESLISQSRTAIAALGGADTGPGALAAAALKGLILNSGRHYAALSLSKGELFTEDLSVSLVVVANLSDWSGLARPSISYSLSDYLSLVLSPIFFFGPDDGEYSYIAGGNLVSLSLGLSLSGSF
jgi:hypothetical protein